MHPGKRSYPNSVSTGIEQSSRAGVCRGARGQHVVDQKNAARLYAPRFGNVERASHIAPPLRRAQSGLRRRIADAHAILGAGGDTQQLGNLGGNQSRLIESPMSLPVGVQRHGQHQIE